MSCITRCVTENCNSLRNYWNTWWIKKLSYQNQKFISSEAWNSCVQLVQFIIHMVNIFPKNCEVYDLTESGLEIIMLLCFILAVSKFKDSLPIPVFQE